MQASSRFITIAFALTIFVSSFSLFVVQPMITKMLLPILGGSPGVWNTCVVFFQAVLLLGYGYAHFITKAPAAAQRLVHLAVLVAAFVILPFDVTNQSPDGLDPTIWLLMTLAISVGLPFFAISATSPLLQAWYARTEAEDAEDPYFLYSASNLGSLIALLGYPLIVERVFTVAGQANAWRWAFVAFAVLLMFCSFISKIGAPAKTTEEQPETETTQSSWGERLRWLVLAFIPSSLMLGVTSYISTDIASFPLIWVIPLAIYLVTFIFVFGKKGGRPPPILGRVMSLLAMAALVALIIGATYPHWVLIPLHLAVITLAAFVCHGELAATRPDASRLTEFYLVMSLGGVLGGALNALVAPQIFNLIWEYPLMIIAAVAVRPQSAADLAKKDLKYSKFIPGFVFVLASAFFLLAKAIELPISQLSVVALLGPPAVLAYSQVERPKRLAVGMLSLMAAGTLFFSTVEDTLYETRDFFGVMSVTEVKGIYRNLIHGNTMHGSVFIEKNDTECVPLTYYHRTGPLGTIFTGMRPSRPAMDVGIIGLGAGSQACYAGKEDVYTYYEISPTVIEIARDSGYFKLLELSEAKEIKYRVGDARVELKKDKDVRYDLLVLDAFSSDSIPTHLITIEAIELYVSRLAENGVIAAHISNRYLRIEPVLAASAKKLGLHAHIFVNKQLTAEEKSVGKEASIWVVIAPTAEALQPILDASPEWRPLDDSDLIEWTDDFTDLISAF